MGTSLNSFSGESRRHVLAHSSSINHDMPRHSLCGSLRFIPKF
jgi:hypothetical protein